MKIVIREIDVVKFIAENDAEAALIKFWVGKATGMIIQSYGGNSRGVTYEASFKFGIGEPNAPVETDKEEGFPELD